MTARHRKVLVVEDDPAAQQMIRNILERSKLNLAVESVSDGRAALELLKKDAVDLICLDLMLPHMSGFEVCESVRNSLKLVVPVLVISARGHPEDRAQAEEAGANGYLKKPFKAKTLVEEVGRLLAAAKGV